MVRQSCVHTIKIQKAVRKKSLPEQLKTSHLNCNAQGVRALPVSNTKMVFRYTCSSLILGHSWGFIVNNLWALFLQLGFVGIISMTIWKRFGLEFLKSGVVAWFVEKTFLGCLRGDYNKASLADRVLFHKMHVAFTKYVQLLNRLSFFSQLVSKILEVIF
jgi:hypothetical protein